MGLGLSLAAHRSGERFQKFPDTAGKYAGYVWTQAVFVKTNLRFHKFPDTAGKYAGYVWTQAVFVKTNLRFHKFPDTCGRCLK